MKRESKSLLLVGAVGILLVGFLLRTIELGSSSLWLDEVHSYERASQVNWQTAYRMLQSSGHAPLYEVILLHYWIKLGTGEYILRLLSVMLGVLNIAAVYALARELFSARIGLWSAALLAASPLHIYYSREVRMYTLAALLTTLGAYSFYKAFFATIPQHKWRHWVTYILSGTLGLYTHYFTGLALTTIFIFGLAWMAFKNNWEALYPLTLAHIGVGFLFAPWLPTVWFQLQRPRLTWIPPLTLEKFLNILTRFFISRPVVDGVYPVLVLFLVLTMLIGLGLFARKRNRRPNRRKSLLFISTYACGPIAIALAISIFKPFVVDRYFLIVVPAACILLALGVIQSVRQPLMIPVVMVLTAGMVVSAYGIATTEWKEDWEGAAFYVESKSMSNDVIIFIPGNLWLPFNHYYHGALPHYDIPGNLTNREEIKQKFDDLKSFSRLWTIQAERFEVNEEIADYIANEYGNEKLFCRTFDEFYDVTACLYSNIPN
jgi:mannosyltransferase